MSSNVVSHLQSQASWRGLKAEEYPDDARSEQSARALYSLVEYIESGEAESRDKSTLPMLEQHAPDGVVGGERAERTVSRYGFGYEVGLTHHEEFLRDLLVACFEDAYEFVREHREDWRDDDSAEYTNTLEWFEVEAAKDNIEIPGRYWELRAAGRQTERQLREYVDSCRER